MIAKQYFLLLAIPLFLFSCAKETELTKDQSDIIHVRNDGADMPAYVYGNAESKCFNILVHGGPGAAGLDYRYGRYYKILEEEMAMVYWDQRGQGMAHGHYPLADLTIDQMAEDLHVLVKTLKHNYGEDISIFVMGHSWGGELSAYYMVNPEYQKEVNGWIAVDGSHDVPLLNLSAIKMFLEIGNAEVSLGNNIEEWAPILEFANGVDTNNISSEDSYQINSFSYQAQDLIAEINQEFSDDSYSVFFSPTNPITSYQSGSNTNTLLDGPIELIALTDELYKIEVPCLLLWGKYDFTCPPALGYSAFEEVGTSEKELVIFEFSGHSPMDNEVDLFCEKVINFVAKYK